MKTCENRITHFCEYKRHDLLLSEEDYNDKVGSCLVGLMCPRGYLSVFLRNTLIPEVHHQSRQAVAAVSLIMQSIKHHQAGGIKLCHLGVLQEPLYILKTESEN